MSKITEIENSPEESIVPLTDNNANVAFFKKKISKNMRKRKTLQASKEASGEEEDSVVVTKERKFDTSHPFVQGTKKGKRNVDDISVTFTANKSALSSVPQDVATRTAEWDTEIDRDAQALLEKKLAADEADDNLYKGQTSYKTYIKKRDTAAGNAASSKIKAGPIRAPSNIRVTSRFDYQPDICKDYKETGYCGYGDSCKFLHDRGDYKSGWQLEREWEEMQGNLRRDKSEFVIKSSDDESDEDLPFACIICRQEYKNPVVTKCGHYFCEKCALQNFAKSPKCYACGSTTNGIFNTAKNILQKLEAKKKLMLEKGENVEQLEGRENVEQLEGRENDAKDNKVNLDDENDISD